MATVSHKLLKLLCIVNLLLFLQACGQVVHTEIQKGLLVKEGSTGKTVELERIPLIELQTPVSVRVFDEVRSGQEYDASYEKIQVQEETYPDGKKKGKTKRTNIPHEYVVEKAYKNIATTKETPPSGVVSVTVNDVQREDIAIGPDGIATVALETYFDTYPEGKDINVKFTYKTAIADSVVTYEEAKKNALALLPTYRQRGGATRSSNDFIVAFKISRDPSDLFTAMTFLRMSSEGERKEIQRLFAEYQAAENSIREEKYKKFVQENCKDTVMDLNELASHRDFKADRGKCVFIMVVKNDDKPIKAGLFKMSDTVFYIELPTAGTGKMVEGLAQIKGGYRYTAEGGAVSTIPRLRYLGQMP